ncbi:hypothetical protein AAMO2058_001006000 [Amorphochlora amoebiformis]
MPSPPEIPTEEEKKELQAEMERDRGNPIRPVDDPSPMPPPPEISGEWRRRRRPMRIDPALMPPPPETPTEEELKEWEAEMERDRGKPIRPVDPSLMPPPPEIPEEWKRNRRPIRIDPALMPAPPETPTEEELKEWEAEMERDRGKPIRPVDPSLMPPPPEIPEEWKYWDRSELLGFDSDSPGEHAHALGRRLETETDSSHGDPSPVVDIRRDEALDAVEIDSSHGGPSPVVDNTRDEALDASDIELDMDVSETVDQLSPNEEEKGETIEDYQYRRTRMILEASHVVPVIFADGTTIHIFIDAHIPETKSCRIESRTTVTPFIVISYKG